MNMEMTRIKIGYMAILNIFVVLLLAVSASGAEKERGKPGLTEGNRGKLKDDMRIFNQVPHSDTVRELFTSIRQTFDQKPRGNLSDISQHLEKADKNGLTMLGGPMLGALAPNGVKVWVRTLKPAKVTVLVKMGDEERIFGPVARTAARDLTAVVDGKGTGAETLDPDRVRVV